MKLNADKCHLLVLGQRCDDPVTVRIGNADVVSSFEEKLLGVQIDSRLAINCMHSLAYRHIWIRAS